MTRVKGGPAARARHKKIKALAKGYRGKRHSTFRMANQAVMKAGTNSYVGRKQKKRDYRRLWISRISATLRNLGLRYSEIKNGWLHSKMDIDRKNLSELAVNYPAIFEKIAALGKK
ncbi:MAG: 50S ribosomal protein L20 [Candidatus Peregrinibacteria bacterium]|nr:50S ribosomal protein L20 [Candidatus Peregrinibacteria bacterium]